MKDWEARLNEILNQKDEQEGDDEGLKKNRKELHRFFKETVLPAFQQMQTVINRHNSELTADIELLPYAMTLRISHEGEEQFFYTVEECRYHKQGAAAFPYFPKPGEEKTSLARVVLPTGKHFEKNFEEITPEILIDDFLEQYGLSI